MTRRPNRRPRPVTHADAVQQVSAQLHGRPATLTELASGLDLSLAATRRALKELRSRGEVARTGAGERGDPYRYAHS